MGKVVLIRPFLPAIKETLYAYVKENNLQPCEDPSNQSDAYMRNRFRRHVIPHMISENPKAPKELLIWRGSYKRMMHFLWATAEEQLGKMIGFTGKGFVRQ